MTDYKMRMIGCTGSFAHIIDFISDVNKFSSKYDIEIQLFDADMIFGENHLISAFDHAKRAFERNDASTHSLGMEILLYASGERQIKKAIEKMGVKKEKSSMIVLFIHNSSQLDSIDNIIDTFLEYFNLKRNDTFIEPDRSKLIEYGISEKAVSTVKSDQIYQLLLEKIALVDVIKK